MSGTNMKTPYFLINKKELDTGLKKLNESLLHAWPNYIIGYSYKTNTLPWVIEYFNNHGCFAEVVSDDEYLLAESIGPIRSTSFITELQKVKRHSWMQ
jgi:diaminopimelate decarboxylase